MLVMLFFHSKSADTSPFFQGLYTVCSFIFVFGLFLDGWAHNHLSSSLETFFTPWHGVFYAGYFLTTLSLLWWTLSRRKKFKTFTASIPAGHKLTLLGSLFFFFGGIGDMIWHIVFGIEFDIEALLSPTHLVLATGMLLMVTGGLRHFWATRKATDTKSIREYKMFLLSLAFTIAMPLFMTQYGHFTDIQASGIKPPNAFDAQAVSVLGILMFSSIATGVLSLALRREKLPFGSIAIVLGLVVWAFSFMRDGRELIPAALLGGLTADIYLDFFYAKKDVLKMRIFAFLLPASFYLFAFLILFVYPGVWWSVHMWAGSIVLAGFAGLLTSVLVWPPKNAI